MAGTDELKPIGVEANTWTGGGRLSVGVEGSVGTDADRFFGGAIFSISLPIAGNWSTSECMHPT